MAKPVPPVSKAISDRIKALTAKLSDGRPTATTALPFTAKDVTITFMKPPVLVRRGVLTTINVQAKVRDRPLVGSKVQLGGLPIAGGGWIPSVATTDSHGIATFERIEFHEAVVLKATVTDAASVSVDDETMVNVL